MDDVYIGEGKPVTGFTWLKGVYRNAVVSYSLAIEETKILALRRYRGNWRIIN